MKLVKKILRLLPLIILLYAMLLPMFTKLPFNVEDYDFTSFMNLFGGYFDIILDEFYYTYGGTPFEYLYIWFENNIVASSILSISFGVLAYELFLSLMFLFYDFINMIFSWANKLMNKGGNLDD